MKSFKQELSDLLYYLFSKPLLSKETNRIIKDQNKRNYWEKEDIPGLNLSFDTYRLGKFLYHRHLKNKNVHDNLCD